VDPKEKQKLMVLFVVFAVVALVLYFNLLLRPQFRKFIAVNREFQAVKARVGSAEALIANEERIKTQYSNLSGEVGLLEERFARQDQVSGLLQDFSGVAESSGAKILRVMPLEAMDDTSGVSSENTFYTEFPILIEARAGYHQCGIFLNKLESMDRFIRVDDIDIKGRTGDPRRHHIKLRVTTYIAQ